MDNKKSRILVVDDEESYRITLASLLEMHEYSVRTANDGVEAINVLQSERFEVALIDIQDRKSVV